jgi:meso-butanediol dehydrogenase / (S,S)-butanediol dehydrogenase / diacetyl reductase
MSTTNHRRSRGNVGGRLGGKVVVVTGLGGGQGREVALLFARAGATVAGCDITDGGIEETFALAKSENLNVEVANVNAADPQAMPAWINSVAERHGGIDVLYNNAGKVHFAPFSDLTIEQWRETLQFELDIVFVPSKAVWPHMIARGGGSIINIASVSGMRGAEVAGTAGAAAHSAAKGGVIGLTNQMAAEGARHWIRVNAISPGPILSPGTKALLEVAGPQFRRVFEGVTLLPRSGLAIDVAFMGLFLASDEAAFVTGVNIPVDGGATSKLGLSINV